MSNQNTEFIVKALLLPRVGRKTAFKLFDSLSFRLSNNQDFFDYILESTDSLKLPKYSKEQFDDVLFDYDEIVRMNEKHGIEFTNCYEDKFPLALKSIIDKPIILSYIGNLDKVNDTPGVAIIGTREPSESGLKAALRFGELFGEASFNVVSGLAIGCDAAGHQGCLNKKGYTTAILAHGLDHVYPKENRSLAEQIIQNDGLIISEYFVGQRPLANYFVERDRLQAGLSQGILVVETDVKGGTMHTVKFAKENGRFIAAFNHVKPELLSHPKAQGNQLLISDGTAISLATAEDIKRYMNLLVGTTTAEDFIQVNNKKVKNEKGETNQLNMFD